MSITRTTFKKGHEVTLEMRRKISEAMIGNKRGIGHKVSRACRATLRQLHLGKPLAQEIKDKIVNTMKLKGIKPAVHYVAYGKDNYFWKDGRTSESKRLRRSVEFRQWREAVYKRDNYSCQNCGLRGVTLHPHHLKSFAEYPHLRFEVSNGQTLCADCHRNTKNYGNRNKVYGLLRKQPQPV